ncbi:hypothetical protein P153DRAFT_365141 [Dothidotthia symphoricarpi CBS 119687]|uniref:Uncharacterized protein n=1 Tax=Dothidotthia symphoricarpi CBS 119687 TaxID=1392245 RepID=A0A6A6AKW7_9PLEO|nr:uncharacterized protein P153DRAFT_365141 [Dothidotthia symphoricarpi CBS 119687]KAF2131564.1 hypothetical protein P153DRAFT_365141 [Dothidotthia symphoricarpi CBS 119687]
MNPSCDSMAQSDKLQQSVSISSEQPPQTPTFDKPPAYHMVVDPNAPIPNMRSPYDPEDEDDENEDDDIPEIIVNASTQIRGSGNIISVAQIDSVRIASLLAAILDGEQPTNATSLHQSPSSTPRGRGRTTKQSLKMNITINCGATIIGDRNIVGPGLGDIARQMQLAQRNQTASMQQQSQNQGQASKSAVAPTPPSSRSPSVPSGVPGGVKRRSDSDAEESVGKRQC